jgi:hypothetical protein
LQVFVSLALTVAEAALTYAFWSTPQTIDPPLDSALAAGFKAAAALSIFIIAYGAISITTGYLVQRITKAFLNRTITPVALKFFEFKVSAWTMRLRLKEFRKVMDAEYKKIAPN